jgi:antitoxin YefM
MKTIIFSKANRDFEAVLDTVNNNADMVLVNRQNGNDAVIMSLAHYNGLVETLYLLKSSANAKHLATSIKQYEGDIANTKIL